MNFTCSYCDVVFSTKQNFNTHLKTKKHLKYYNLIENKVKQCKEEINILKSENERLQIENENLKSCPSLVHQLSITCPSLVHQFNCEFCHTTYKTQSSLSKHKRNCVNKKIYIIEKENSEYKKKIEILEKENKELKESSKDITKLALTNQKSNTNINSSYNIIINQFKNAPNLTLPKDLVINESLDKYIESGNPQGIINFLDKYYGSKVPPESRSLWCIDATRCKFVLKHNDEWLIDLDANKFRELTFYPLQDMFYQKQKKIMNTTSIDYNELDNNKLLSNVNFLGGFVDKKEQMKIIRDFSKKIHFKKNIDIEEIQENVKD
jgi:hypothetical protein